MNEAGFMLLLLIPALDIVTALEGLTVKHSIV
jgi:hypothetical protein